MADIVQTFTGKSLFMTGVTGFLGKVLLYKILKEFPDIESIYVLCRPKKNVTMQQRFEKEVLSSPCFHPLIKSVGEEKWKKLTAKCHPVAGDIMFHRLGLSNEDYELLCSKLHFIIHLAATVDFQEKLNVSLDMNCLGSIRVLSLAQRCPKLEAFVHTSTCYVNYPRHGATPIHEQIYPLDYDPEVMAKYIMSLTDAQIPAETKRLLTKYGYANTYTFTKNITESILARRRGNVPMAIVRPSIVGCAWKEPIQGWVDVLTACGGIFLMVGLGLLNDLVCDITSVSDVVPVDYVVNVLLKVTHKTSVDHRAYLESLTAVPSSKPAITSPLKEAAVGLSVTGKSAQPVASQTSTALQRVSAASASAATTENVIHSVTSAKQNDGSDSAISDPGQSGIPLRVYQCSTSVTMNPCRWEAVQRGYFPFWEALKHPKALGRPFMRFHSNNASFVTTMYVRKIIPLQFAKMLNMLPWLHDAKKAQMIARYEKTLVRNFDLNAQFSPFMKNFWHFECFNTDALDESLLPQQRASFSHDVLDINWPHYGAAYSWGMVRYIMKDEKVPQPKAPPSGPELFMKAFL